MRRKRIIAASMVMCLIVGISGCVKKDGLSAETESIELIEPVNTSSNMETAEYRNLYDYKIMSGFIYPVIQEYSLVTAAPLLEYMVAPGDHVEEGDLLLTTDDSSLAKEIERLEETYSKFDENYENSRAAIEDAVASVNAQIERLLSDKEKAEETLATYSDTESDGYRAALDRLIDINVSIAACRLQLEQNMIRISQTAELYELDSEYNRKHLERLYEQKANYSVTSGISGTVVSACDITEGSWLNSGTPVVAVADETQKVLKCEYIPKTDIAKCEDIYAIINGERYEITYQPYDTSEYERLLAQNGKVYTSFTIDDKEGKLKTGDFAVIAQIYGREINVLTVSKNALHRDENGSYVYCITDDGTVKVDVRTGKTDGVYTEITQGIKAGDKVLLTESNNYGENVITISRGDFFYNYSGDGSLDYNVVKRTISPIEHGKVCFVEYNVEYFDNVKVGDVIATVRVEGDEMYLYQKKNELERQEQRLVDAIAADNRSEIEQRREVIKNLKEEIDKLEADYAATEIISQAEGMIVRLENYRKDDTVQYKGNIAQIADKRNTYITVKDENGLLCLGTEVTVEYTDEQNVTRTTTGTVVTASGAGISPRLVSQSVYIRIPDEITEQLSPITFGGGYVFWTTFPVKAKARQMKNVLLIPKKAVREIFGNTYVYVRGDDGTVVLKSFIAGGYDANYYWVLEGLEEGMIICSE